MISKGKRWPGGHLCNTLVIQSFEVERFRFLNFVPAKGQTGFRARLQISEYYEESGKTIRHRRAAQGGKRGCHGGRRERNQTRHQCISLRTDRDTEEFRHEYVNRGEQRYR